LSSQTQVKSLVSTDWIADHAKDAGLRLVEVDVDPTNYEKGHIEGAVGWNWKRDLQDQVARDIAPKDALAQLLGRSGISADTNIVLYGDNNNWFAAELRGQICGLEGWAADVELGDHLGAIAGQDPDGVGSIQGPQLEGVRRPMLEHGVCGGDAQPVAALLGL